MAYADGFHLIDKGSLMMLLGSTLDEFVREVVETVMSMPLDFLHHAPGSIQAAHAASSCSQGLAFSGVAPAEFFHPLAFHLESHCVIPLMRY